MATSIARVPPEILIASNRGPVSFVRDERGEVSATRGLGGLVTALTGALQAWGGLWVASAMTPEDRRQAIRGRIEVPTEGMPFNVRYLAFEPGEFDRFYNGISNRILWFVHHYLWDVVRTPQFGDETRRDWEAFTRINEGFAEALDAEAGSTGREPAYLVQDYHLSLVPSMLRRRRPAARIAHFSHIPFAGPGYFGILPAGIQEQLLTGLLGADVLGFQAERWAENFLLCCRRLDGARVDLRRRLVRWAGREVRVRVYPIAIDWARLEAAADGPNVEPARRRLSRKLAEMKLILRVDRAELSKNILRGFLAYEALLARYPEWRRRVRFVALLNPSREAVPEYRSYVRECLEAADRINAEVGEEGWQPVEVHVKDDWPAALAAYSLYDVLLVNPVFDGMNLVAKEGPLLNRRGGVLVLSENAGAFAELSRHALVVNPFDVAATTRSLAEALAMDEAERRRRARGLRAAIRRNTLERWVGDQLRDLERANPWPSSQRAPGGG